jgi:GntR family transcriptional regulator
MQGRPGDTMALERTGVPNGIAIYAKIASILRSQISSGQLTVGTRLPSIGQMSETYKVAPVTIRLAVRLLVEEGLLSSHRGRGTYVIDGGSYRELKLLRGQSAPDAAAPSISAKVVHHARVAAVPEELQFGRRSEGDYEWIKRIHSRADRMVFVMDAYIGDDLYRTLPRNIDQRLMIPDLLREEFLARNAEVVTTVTVGSADLEISALLGCDLSFPVAQIARVFVDRTDRILVSSKATYRADIFYMQTRQTMKQFLSSRTPSSVRLTD